MNDRGRLVELVKDARDAELHFCSSCFDSDECLATGYCDKSLKVEADHLIANGVTVQKHGRWISRGGYRYCSECAKRACVTRDSEDFWYTVGTNYCPNCGAKMDGEADGK